MQDRSGRVGGISEPIAATPLVNRRRIRRTLYTKIRIFTNTYAYARVAVVQVFARKRRCTRKQTKR